MHWRARASLSLTVSLYTLKFSHPPALCVSLFFAFFLYLFISFSHRILFTSFFFLFTFFGPLTSRIFTTHIYLHNQTIHRPTLCILVPYAKSTNAISLIDNSTCICIYLFIYVQVYIYTHMGALQKVGTNNNGRSNIVLFYQNFSFIFFLSTSFIYSFTFLSALHCTIRCNTNTFTRKYVCIYVLYTCLILHTDPNIANPKINEE